jgi:hypothetical protein
MWGFHSTDRSHHQGLPQPRGDAIGQRFLVAPALASIFGDAGLSPAFITAMASGERPANMSPDEATMYDFCTQLLSTRQVSDTNFWAAKALIGERGIVEIAGLMGQYTGLTMLFVVDRYPVSAGAPDEVNRPM